MTLATDLPLVLPIAALLPLTALLLVGQSNPYQSLILRGILGGWGSPDSVDTDQEFTGVSVRAAMHACS